MVKGSNSVKNKKLHSSKPYDVSNSFVKKVTSHVTNLLPPKTWISKWFTSTENNEVPRRDALNSNDSGSEDEDDDNTTVLPPPSKRAKIPLNQQFPPNSFNVSPVVNDEVSNRAGPSSIVSGNYVTDNAVAGPSGINTRPQLVSSTPNVQSTATNLLSASERKLNGDDRSESSESTSGCSSLVPQANRQFQASETATNNLSARRRSIDEKLNFTGHLQSPRSLFSDRNYSRTPRLNSALSRRRPSFNVSTFSSPVQAKDRISVQNRIVTSPFYAGKTTYGGASAYRRTRDGFPLPNEVTVPKRGVQVKPVDCDSDSLSSMSTTARRILEALEQFSSPVHDAKRIPLQTAPSLSSKRKRLSDMGQSPGLRIGESSGLRIGQSPRTPNSAKPLTVPTVPDLLKMKHREKLQDTMEAARLIAVSSANNSVPSCKSTSSQGYRLRFEDNEKPGKHGGKIRSKEKELEEETVEEVSLPAISLPVTTLPKFDFVVPPAVSAPSVISTFKFSSPITVTENARTCKPVNNFTFSKPLSIGNKDMVNYNTKKVNCINTSVPNCSVKPSELQFKSGSDNKFVLSERAESKNVLNNSNGQNSEVFFGIKPAAELNTGSVMDILGKMSSSVDKEESKEVSSSSNISLDKFKPAPGMWECSSCMIRNKSDDTKCVCCETPRTIVSTPSSTTASSLEKWECSSCHTSNMLSSVACSKCSVSRVGQTSQVKETSISHEKFIPKEHGFGNKFKPPSGSWECNTCLVRNPDSSTLCQACETKRPGLANQSSATSSSKPTSSSGFGDKFKKPEGSWECPACMVCNKGDSLKCVACEGAKPGTELNTSTKFNFVIPAEASGFKFGVDKAGDTPKESVLPKPDPLGFKFGETKITTPSNFSFGVNSSISSTTKSATATTSVSAVTTPSFSFGTTTFSLSSSKTDVKPADTSSFSQSGFSFGVPQTSKFQSPAPSGDKIPEEGPRKRRASETGEVFADSKNMRSKESERNTSSVLASSSEAPVHKNIEEKPEQKVSFAFGSSSGPTFTNEPNTSTKSTDNAKTTFTGIGSTVSGGLRLDKPANLGFPGSTGVASSTILGNNASLTKIANPTTTATAVTSSTIAATSTSSSHTTALATVTSSTSNLFTFSSSKPPVAFGSSCTSISFGQSSATTSASSSAFGTALKTTSASPSFSFSSQIKPFSANSESAPTSTSKTQALTFGSITSTVAAPAFGTCTSTTIATTTTTTAASSISSQSVPSFGTVTSAPSFSMGTRSTIPAFGTSNTSTTTSNSNMTSSSATFGSMASPNFSSGFTALTDQNKQSSKSISNPAPFAFGSNTNNNTSSLGTTAPFSFGNVQSDQGVTSKGTFTFGAPSSNASLGSSTNATPAASSGFGFVASNPAPAFSFGSSASPACNPAASSLFGSTNTNATPAATGGPIFGSTTAGSFGSNAPGGTNTTSTTFSAPTFNFGATNTQPSSSVFGFTGSQASGATTTPGQNFAASTPNFSFGQMPTSAQTPGQPALPTFNPNVKPSFNFTGGETPTFTAATGSPAPGPRRIKKAVRRAVHPR